MNKPTSKRTRKAVKSKSKQGSTDLMNDDLLYYAGGGDLAFMGCMEGKSGRMEYEFRKIIADY